MTFDLYRVTDTRRHYDDGFHVQNVVMAALVSEMLAQRMSLVRSIDTTVVAS
jgi:hypothetical protein